MQKPNLTKEQKEILIKEFAGKKMPDFEFGNPFEIFDSLTGNGFGRKKGFSSKTMAIIKKAQDIIGQYNVRLTVRQIYYRFVGEQLIENNIKSYKRLASVLAKARESGYIGYDKIVDRTRQVIKSNSWTSPKDFFETVKKAYRKNLLDNQDNYIEVWVEKDALAGVFEPITDAFDINLVVGRGYPSHSALYDASLRMNKNSDKTKKVLYFGDFDPSGEDIYRDVQVRMRDLFGQVADFTKVSLTLEDIETYNLPPAPAKRSDSRTNAFVAKNGDVSVELDALPPDILENKIKEAILDNIDIAKYQIRLDQEDAEKLEIERLIQNI